MVIEFRENNLLEPERRDALRRTVSRAIGESPGRWIVDVYEYETPPRLRMTVIGPYAFGIWRKSFHGGAGITLREIEEAISEAVKSRLAD